MNDRHVEQPEESCKNDVHKYWRVGEICKGEKENWRKAYPNESSISCATYYEAVEDEKEI